MKATQPLELTIRLVACLRRAEYRHRSHLHTGSATNAIGCYAIEACTPYWETLSSTEGSVIVLVIRRTDCPRQPTKLLDQHAVKIKFVLIS